MFCLLLCQSHNYCFYITKFKCSFVIISTCLPFWQRELSAKTLVTEVIKFRIQCQHGNNPGYIIYKVNVHFCLHPTLSFVICWISAQKACRQYLHAACTVYTTYTLSVLFALLLRLHSALLFVICWISAQKACRQCLHPACTICTITSSAFCTIVRNVLNISTKSV